MDARLQRRVQRYGWDRAAECYERSWSEQLAPAQAKLLEMAALRSGEAVLDVASGTGLVTFPAARQVGPEGRVVGTDISERMVEMGRGEAQRLGLGQVTFERTDAESEHFEAETFDVILCGLGLMYVPDPGVALREWYRILRPGGRAVAAVWGQRNNCGWAEIFPIVDAKVSTEVCPLFFLLGTGDTLAATFTEAGFTDVRTERLTASLHYASAEDALEAAFVGGPVALAYSRFDETTRERAHEEYLASIEPFRNGGAYEIPGEFVVTRGTK